MIIVILHAWIAVFEVMKQGWWVTAGKAHGTFLATPRQPSSAPAIFDAQHWKYLIGRGYECSHTGMSYVCTRNQIR